MRHISWQEKLSVACSAGLGIASMLIALLVRVLFTYVCVLCAGFTTKEKAFIALAWMPKATVQVCLRWFYWTFFSAFRRKDFWSFSRLLLAPRL